MADERTHYAAMSAIPGETTPACHLRATGEERRRRLEEPRVRGAGADELVDCGDCIEVRREWAALDGA